MPSDEPKVVASATDPEASRITGVVESGDLRLDGTREVLIGVVVLSIGLRKGVALVGVQRPIDDRSLPK
jgi:hypothetical protein